MEKEFVTYEIALKLKKLGFDEIPRFGHEASLYDNVGNHVKAMKEACKQTLELAAENAKILHWDTHDTDLDEYEINKQSILETINQIK